jgi:Zn-dependent M28 family amino/carboxypeptidase
MKLDKKAVDRLDADEALWNDFNAICDCGGRLSGTESERRALALVKARASDATGVPPRSLPVPYGGWSATKGELRLPDGSVAHCHPLVRTAATPPGGLSAEVIDLGRGTPGEFDAHAAEIPGRIVLVRHELMFAAGTIHRRLKYEMALKAGALGFLIAGPVAGSPVSGSSGRDGAEGIPAAGISRDAAARLRRTAAGWPRVSLEIATNEFPATTETLLFDIAGRTDEWVVLSAHVDGHDLAESAMDNATGVAAALSAARALCSDPTPRMRGLRLAFFSVEEWALTGSAQYVKGLSASERARIVLNVNLDSIAGSPNLSALTSGFAALEPFLLRVAEANGLALRTVRPLMMNSDHANFALAGIPALRLVAGFDEPDADLRFVLTAQDRRDKVARGDLQRATRLAAAIVGAACAASPAEAARWRDAGLGG